MILGDTCSLQLPLFFYPAGLGHPSTEERAQARDFKTCCDSPASSSGGIEGYWTKKKMICWMVRPVLEIWGERLSNSVPQASTKEIWLRIGQLCLINHSFLTKRGLFWSLPSIILMYASSFTQMMPETIRWLASCFYKNCGDWRISFNKQASVAKALSPQR